MRTPQENLRWLLLATTTLTAIVYTLLFLSALWFFSPNGPGANIGDGPRAMTGLALGVIGWYIVYTLIRPIGRHEAEDDKEME